MLRVPMLICFLTAACSANDHPEHDGGAAPDSSAQSNFVSTNVRDNPNNTLSAIVSIELGEPAPTRVEVSLDGNILFSTPWTGSGTEHEITVVGLRKELDYLLIPIALAGDNIERSDAMPFRTGVLPAGIPSMVATTSMTGMAFSEHDPNLMTRATLIGVGGEGPAYVGVDLDGEVIWYYAPTDGEAAIGDAKPLDDGTLLVFLRNEVRIIDIGGNTLERFAVAGFHHDAELLPNGNLLAIVRDTRNVSGQEIVGDSLREVTSLGNTVWEWSTFDHVPLERFPGPLSMGTSMMGGVDWTHSNAVVYVPDEDAVLLSIRHQSWVVKIDRATGDILWHLGPDGDFELTSGAWFYNQHAPEISASGTILLFDNGNERPTDNRLSRGVAYQLDVANMTATQTWEHEFDILAGALGDADDVDGGSVLLCAGSIRDGASPTPRSQLVQIDSLSGDVEWTLDIEGPTYRATRLSSLYFGSI